MEAETINAILLAMAVHIRRPEVCEQGFITFSNILLNGITIITHINEIFNYLFIYFSADNQIRAGRAGAVGTIIMAINANINNVQVCKEGCIALYNITLNSKITK